jgi:hypothetical protein
MKIETIEIAGFAAAVKALRLPFGKECRSHVHHTEEILPPYGIVCGNGADIDEKDMHLMGVLVRRGDEHAKVIRGVIAYAEIEAPVYWWCELETYRAGHERLSSESTMHIDCKGLSGAELVKAKSEIPMGKTLKKVDLFSYQCLRNIVRQRKGHRLPEWAQFIDWVRSLPFANELIFTGLEDDTEERN